MPADMKTRGLALATLLPFPDCPAVLHLCSLVSSSRHALESLLEGQISWVATALRRGGSNNPKTEGERKEGRKKTSEKTEKERNLRGGTITRGYKGD